MWQSRGAAAFGASLYRLQRFTCVSRAAVVGVRRDWSCHSFVTSPAILVQARSPGSLSTRIVLFRSCVASFTRHASGLPEPNGAPVKLNIFYGSQTGTAQQFASLLAESLTSSHGNIMVHDLRDVNDASVWAAGAVGHISIFLVSCFGRGDPTDSAKRFFASLNSVKPGSLTGASVAVFGLGSSKTHKE